ncbi:hypothetical protein [Corynebacterium macclintockiae]|uniref:hypothetical protein n=1 Tax=Corynebacterium macclintockiae TaxID=2913501 RepID=UPI003EB6FEAE
MESFTSHFPDSPGWSIIAVLIALTFGPLAVFSRDSAEKLWVFGRVVAWFRTRQQRSIEQERALEEVTVRHLKGKISSLDMQLEEIRADFDEEREDARRREASIRSEFEEAKSYIVYSTGWAHRVLVMHAQYGWKPPIPEWLPFDDWMRARRDKRAGSD